MKVTLNDVEYLPQGASWCEEACILLAISIRLLEKYKIKKIWDPEVFFKKHHFDISSPTEIWKFIKKQDVELSECDLAFAFSIEKSKPKIEKNIKNKVPMIVNIRDWDIINGSIVRGARDGHFFVLYGFDDDFFYLHNPWGIEWDAKILRSDHSFLNSFFSVI